MTLGDDVNDPFDLSAKTILVTGASSGLGAHFAGALGARGAALVLAARRLDRLEAVADGLRALGRQVTTVAMDVTDAASIDVALDAAGPIDVVVNNSGVTLAKPVLEQEIGRAHV